MGRILQGPLLCHLAAQELNHFGPAFGPEMGSVPSSRSVILLLRCLLAMTLPVPLLLLSPSSASSSLSPSSSSSSTSSSLWCCSAAQKVEAVTSTTRTQSSPHGEGCTALTMRAVERQFQKAPIPPSFSSSQLPHQILDGLAALGHSGWRERIGEGRHDGTLLPRLRTRVLHARVRAPTFGRVVRPRILCGSPLVQTSRVESCVLSWTASNNVMFCTCCRQRSATNVATRTPFQFPGRKTQPYAVASVARLLRRMGPTFWL